jgi:hypothetical protein
MYFSVLLKEYYEDNNIRNIKFKTTVGQTTTLNNKQN